MGKVVTRACFSLTLIIHEKSLRVYSIEKGEGELTGELRDEKTNAFTTIDFKKGKRGCKGFGYSRRREKSTRRLFGDTKSKKKGRMRKVLREIFRTEGL